MTKARSEEVLMAGSDLDTKCSGRASVKLSLAPLGAVGSSSVQIAFVTLAAISRGVSS